jgi:hypothetical protein
MLPVFAGCLAALHDRPLYEDIDINVVHAFFLQGLRDMD